MSLEIRTATAADAAAIAAIYAPVVHHTPISFETAPPSAEVMGTRIAATLATLPWLVCTRDGHVWGYAYASQHRQRHAYQWSVDVSAYVDAQVQRSGIGRRLYTALFEILRLQGYYNAFAGITLPNEASVGLHTAMGFEAVGVFRDVGYKLGAWHDVGWWHLRLRPHAGPPAELIAYPELADSVEVQAALKLAVGAVLPE
jgi:L-amino acid N-acyltransferase YncA